MSTKQKPSTPAKAPKGSRRVMQVGVRSAVAICEGRKTSLVAAGAEHPWLTRLKTGNQIRLNFRDRRRGWAVIQVRRVCHHDQIARIPDCGQGHRAVAIDSDGSWESILAKAWHGGTTPVEAPVLERRAAQGWYVLDFAVVERHRPWCEARGIAEPTTVA